MLIETEDEIFVDVRWTKNKQSSFYCLLVCNKTKLHYYRWIAHCSLLAEILSNAA